MKRNEYGSDFHYDLDSKITLEPGRESLFINNDFALFFSGRSALKALVSKGIEVEKWKKIFFPSYYCHEVVNFIRELPLEVDYYEYSPFLDATDKVLDVSDQQGNVIVNVDFFGLKKLELAHYKAATIIDDLTHNITGFSTSTASYCFASLRKELPIPCGGYCYSPLGYELPSGQFDVQSEEIAVKKLTAMYLKNLYLNGKFDSKDDFRNLFAEAEQEFSTDKGNVALPKTSEAVLSLLSVEKILEAKHRNIQIALHELSSCEEIEFNLGTGKNNSLGLLLRFKNELQRNACRDYLVAESIFPAVLWPHQKRERDILTEKLVLFIHLDYRYNKEQVDKIIGKIKLFLNT